MFLSKGYDFSFKPTVLVINEDPPAPPTITPEIQAILDAQIATAVAAAVEKETTGLKNKNTELLGKIKDTTTRLAAFGNLDPEAAKKLVETMDHDEDLKLFSEGKKAVVIDKYTERMRTSHAAELEAEKQRTIEQQKRGDAYQNAVLDNQIRSVTNECHKGAIDDALLLARQIFTLDAKGVAVKLDSEGRPELGKDGKTPFSPSEWMEMQRELKPHWFPAASSGGGSGGASGAAGTGKTIKRAAYDALTPVQQGGVARSGVQIVD